MKKLMIAALAIAVSGVASAACDEGKYCVWAYRLKLAGKTVVARSTESNKVTCAEGKCYAKPASYRVAGYIWGAAESAPAECSSCECVDPVFTDSIFWDANKHEVKFASGAFEVLDLLRNGGLFNKLQIGIKLDDLYLAGFGVFNPRTKKMKSANGFFAGTLATPKCSAYDASTCTEVEGDEALVFKPCEYDTTAPDAAAKVIAYGRWSLTYRQDKVTIMEKTGDVRCFQPTGFKSAN